MKLKPIRIGSVEVKPNLALAPMSGITNSAFRRLIQSENPMSLGLMVTEFISVEGLTRQNRRSLDMMRFSDSERPISIQIFGHDINRMVDAAKMVEDAGADIVDINCGCPVPKVVRRGGGCELMRQPQHLEKILTAVKKAVNIPLTLKMRTGWCSDSLNAPEIARLAEACGVDMLAVHGRTRADLYRGECDWGRIGEVAEAVSIPVFGSGDVVDRETAKKALSCPVSGLMIGRGALLNPWVFSEIRATANGESWSPQPLSATAEVLEKYAVLLREALPEKAVSGRLKQMTTYVSKRVKGSADIRRTLCRTSSVEEFLLRVSEWKAELKALDMRALDRRGVESRSGHSDQRQIEV